MPKAKPEYARAIAIASEVKKTFEKHDAAIQQMLQEAPNVVRLLQKSGLSLQKIGDECGLSKTFLSFILNGQSKCPVWLFIKMVSMLK